MLPGVGDHEARTGHNYRWCRHREVWDNGSGQDCGSVPAI